MFLTLKTVGSYPPTPEEYGVLLSQKLLLAEMLEGLSLAAQRSLPDCAPFDLLRPQDTALWRICQDAEQLLRHCGYGPLPLPWCEPSEEEQPDEEA